VTEGSLEVKKGENEEERNEKSGETESKGSNFRKTTVACRKTISALLREKGEGGRLADGGVGNEERHQGKEDS